MFCVYPHLPQIVGKVEGGVRWRKVNRNLTECNFFGKPCVYYITKGQKATSICCTSLSPPFTKIGSSKEEALTLKLCRLTTLALPKLLLAQWELCGALPTLFLVFLDRCFRGRDLHLLLFALRFLFRALVFLLLSTAHA